MWAMLKGQLPFENVEDSRMVALMAAKGARPPFPSDKTGIDKILKQGWSSDPQSRPAAQKMAGLVEAVLFREQNRGTFWKAIRGNSGKWTKCLNFSLAPNPPLALLSRTQSRAEEEQGFRFGIAGLKWRGPNSAVSYDAATILLFLVGRFLRAGHRIMIAQVFEGMGHRLVETIPQAC
eukprot:1272897-Rhodomonas_salina.3